MACFFPQLDTDKLALPVNPSPLSPSPIPSPSTKLENSTLLTVEPSPLDKNKGFFVDESEPLLRCDSTSSGSSALSRNGSFITKGTDGWHSPFVLKPPPEQPLGSLPRLVPRSSRSRMNWMTCPGPRGEASLWETMSLPIRDPPGKSLQPRLSGRGPCPGVSVTLSSHWCYQVFRGKSDKV